MAVASPLVNNGQRLSALLAGLDGKRADGKGVAVLKEIVSIAKDSGFKAVKSSKDVIKMVHNRSNEGGLREIREQFQVVRNDSGVFKTTYSYLAW